jgi:alkane 1-monooxygenase
MFTRVPARDLGFLFPYALIGGVFTLVHVTGQFRGIGLAIAFILIPTLDYLIGLNTRNFSPEDEKRADGHWYYEAILLGWVPVQLGLITLGVSKIYANPEIPLWVAALLGIPLGLGNGGIGITIAHELGHRNNALDKWAARILLVSVGYGHFIIEHNRGHHVRVATPGDPATSRFGEGFWRFFVRTVPTQYFSAWHLENERCRRAYGSAATPRNHMLWYTLAPVALVAGFGLWLGAAVAVYLVTQAFFAFWLLEAVNYVEHYGLLRKKTDGGAYEKVQPHHSWNSAHAISNYLLFSLQRHSDHHAYAGRRYEILRHTEGAPQLPGGYPTMILLALFPPLWRRVMDEKVLAARESAGVPLEVSASAGASAHAQAA